MTDSKTSLLVATNYTDTKAANSNTVTNEYGNVQQIAITTRNAGTSPYNASGPLRASKRTTLAGNDVYAGNYLAMRSAQINPLYYDPNKTYSPRVDYTGSGNYGAVESASSYIIVDDQSASTTSNAHPATVYYPDIRRIKIGDASNTDKFTYVLCSTYKGASLSNTPDSNCTVNNKTKQVVDVTKVTTTVTLPVGNNRTDCGAQPALTCTGALERQNILNWYNYYRTRAKIAGTSIGAALANPAYSGKMRIGYFNINSGGSKNSSPNWSGNSYAKGVRNFVLGSSTDNTNDVKPLYDWLYSQSPDGKTPLHNAIQQVGEYYKTAQPWYNDPTVTTADTVNLSCRRSYNILFSDGAWNQGTNTTVNPIPYNQSALKPVDGSGNAVTLSPPFTYSKFGDTSNFNSYTAYGDAGAGETGSLATLTSSYYWGQDLRNTLANNVPTRSGEPTSWQNMKTYTIGYGIAPTGFEFDDIKTWSRFFPKVGYSSDLVPAWPTNAVGGTDFDRIDDFIHAGYTGGGAAYSVRSADDIQRAFDLVLSDVVSASGNDAGVAVSGASSSVSTIEGSLKYTVDYKTLDNSGDVKAWKLDANGSNASVNAIWSAKNNMPQPVDRGMSTLSAAGTGVLLGANTRLDSLPADIQTLLKNGNTNLLPDESFIRYLRGDDGITDSSGNLFRRRSSLVAASVNAPPAFAGGRLNMGYDRTTSAVGGKTAYASYITLKTSIPGTIYAPTNDGLVHVINAADDTAVPSQKIKNSSGSVIDPGTEVWSYLIRGSLSKMQDFADPGYQFAYVLDGPIAEHDIYDATSSSWKQMLYGSLGRAGKGGIYALNVPMDTTTAGNYNRIPNQNGYKWDVSPADMGNVTNGVTAGQAKSGDWVVLASSGHYANTGKAGLYVLNANTGAVIKFLQLPAGYNFKRGLGGVVAVRDATRTIVGAYAGDDGGNLWRFDLLDANPANWVVSYGKPLFTTDANQPIYVAPAWTPHPGDNLPAAAGGCMDGRLVPDGNGNNYPQQCGAMVVFGTGMLMDADDSTNNVTQTIYGIWDKNPIGKPVSVAYQAINKTTDLLQQNIIASPTAGQGINSDKTFYKVTANTPNWAVHRGWYLNLGQLPNSTGERVIGDVFNLGSNVFVGSLVPNAGATGVETCTVKSSPPNFLYGLDALSGGLKRAFDQNGDGRFDQFSIAYIPGGGFTRGSVITQTSKDPASTTGLGLPNEGDPDLKVKKACTGEQGYNTGISGSVAVGDGCPAGWNRSWRQLMVPPQ
jgi:Tfp pilus tip-associated adhesin PilY1